MMIENSQNEKLTLEIKYMVDKRLKELKITKEWLTVEELAGFLRCSVRTIRRWNSQREQGKNVGVRFNRGDKHQQARYLVTNIYQYFIDTMI